MSAWKSKRVKESKKIKGRWSKLKDSKSKSRKRDSIKQHYTRKVYRSSKGDRDEFSKFLKSKKRKDAWKPKTRKKDSPKSKKSKTVKKSKRWTRDFDLDAMLEVSQEELKNHRGTGRLFDDKKINSPGLGLPNWPPKPHSPSKLPPPLFNPSISPSPSINLTEDDYKVLESVVKDDLKSPKPKLLRPMDLTGVKSKRNPDLLTPAQILLTKPSDLGDKPKKTRKRRKSQPTKKKKQKTQKKTKQMGGICFTKKCREKRAEKIKEETQSDKSYAFKFRLEACQGEPDFSTCMKESKGETISMEDVQKILKDSSTRVKSKSMPGRLSRPPGQRYRVKIPHSPPGIKKKQIKEKAKSI